MVCVLGVCGFSGIWVVFLGFWFWLGLFVLGVWVGVEVLLCCFVISLGVGAEICSEPSREPVWGAGVVLCGVQGVFDALQGSARYSQGCRLQGTRKVCVSGISSRQKSLGGCGTVRGA